MIRVDDYGWNDGYLFEAGLNEKAVQNNYFALAF